MEVKLKKQEYNNFPKTINDVKGESSKTIFKFMVGALEYTNGYYDKELCNYPYDVDDWERNRSLLLERPKWKDRLIEMSCLGKEWKSLVENWSEIERLYNKDYEEFGNKRFGEKDGCDAYIRSLVGNDC